MKKYIYLLLLPLLLGCVAQKQIWFGDRNNSSSADNNVIRVYTDKYGYFYPDADIAINKKKFINGNRCHSIRANENNANLLQYFTTNKNEINNLANYYKVPVMEKDTILFDSIQKRITEKIGEDIKNLKKENRTDELVIFIHGFNMEYPTPVYDRLRKYIESHKPDKKRVFMEIYWDGLSGNNFDAKRFWSFAQLNSSYVANAVRKIINVSGKDTKIRIITHSLGGSVGTGALFNTNSKWKNYENEDYYKERWQIATPTPKDIRIGMIAPAIPGANTFVDFNCRTERKKFKKIKPEDNNISRVIIGYKQNDAVLNKYVNISKKFGATTLGANTLVCRKTEEREIDNVEKEMKELGYDDKNTPIRTVDFKDSAFEKEHGWYYYLQNEYALDKFLNQLFD